MWQSLKRIKMKIVKKEDAKELKNSITSSLLEYSINKNDEHFNFKTGDVLLIEKGEIYFWDGNCKLIMICTPAWYKEQCELIDEGKL